MARVFFLSTAAPFDPATGVGSDELRRWSEVASRDRFREHTVVDDPESADLILFVDSASPDLRDIRQHPLLRDRREDCFVIHHGDRIYPFVPGVFTCPERGTHSRYRSRTGSYLTVLENDKIVPAASMNSPRWLFSFVGRSDSAPVRRRILQLPEAEALLIDTAHKSMPLTDYLRAIHQSAFVLCPRGFGSSSYRLFETMKAGRAPVVISDAWIPADGPVWDEFAVFVTESKVQHIPEILNARRKEHRERGTAARLAWEEWFGPETVFHRTVEACSAIKRERLLPERICGPLTSLARIRPSYILKRFGW